MHLSPIYGVMGNPIAHSKSPLIHAHFAQQIGLSINYAKILVPLDDFAHGLRSFINKNGLGANVTTPFKEQAASLCDDLSEFASLAGAVNTLSIKENKIYGDNTDGPGLICDLKYRHKINLKDKKILIIGAGGAARGIIGALLSEYPQSVTIVNRTLSKAHDLCAVFNDLAQHKQASLACLSFEQLNNPDQKYTYDLIINASSSSLHGDLPKLPVNLFHADMSVYDLMYSSDLTSFLQFCREHNVHKLYDGLGMLVEQAALSFEIWLGVKPDTAEIYKLLR